MKRFSQIYEIGLDQPQLDFVDIIPSRDTPLFIDPFAISIRNDSWSEACHLHITHFFKTALEHVRAGRVEKAQALLNGLNEPNETCLGLSTEKPRGRGVSGKQAIDLYDSLAQSQAAKTGILSELAECDLFVKNIGPDKISDITTNIIRKLLIDYTASQCELHDVKLIGEYQTGRYWNMDELSWSSGYAPMPVVDGNRLILVPKFSVRRDMRLDSQEFYSHHVVNFIQQEEYERGSSLVRVLKSGERRPPYKKAIQEKHPFSKDFLARFSQDNPDVLEDYKNFYAKIDGAKGVLENSDFDENFREDIFSLSIQEKLKKIPKGLESASEYHSFVIGALEFIFWPNLIYPKKETPIHEGRKRIDITYTNAAKEGLFYRAHTAYDISSNFIMVECKNYTKDIANPELDQLSGRFSVNRGRLGLLLYRDVSDYAQLCKRCRDTASDGRGIIIPLGDEQLLEYLDLIARGARAGIDQRLEDILRTLMN